MNKDLQDKYIFDFLDGNLSEKEEALFHDLVNEDIDFRNEYLGWKDTYFNTSAPIQSFDKKAALKKKSILPRVLVISSILLLFIGSATYLGLEQTEDSEEVSLKIQPNIKQEIASNVPKSETNIEVIINKKLKEEVRSWVKVLSSDDKYVHTNELHHKTDEPIIPTESRAEDPIIDSLPILNEDTIELSVIEQEPMDTIQQKQVNNESIEKNHEIVKPSKLARKIIRKEKRKNNKHEIPTWEQLKDAFKDQRVIPVE